MRNWFPFLWGRSKKTEDVDVEKYVRAIAGGEGDFIEEEGITYVKSINIAKDTAINETVRELERGNLVVLDIKDMLRDPIELNERVSKIRKYCSSSGGDICGIARTKLMVVPVGIEIAYSS